MTQKKMITRLDPKKEALKRDYVLNALEKERQELISAARRVAYIIYQENPHPLTAGEIFEAMSNVDGMENILINHDKRWLGAVFRKGFLKAGFSFTGSHCRPVHTWVPESSKLSRENR